MDFTTLVNKYKEGNSSQSPIWIWFQKEKDGAKCLICQTHVITKGFSTTNLIAHLKRHHGYLKKYNAWKDFDELTSLKDERIRNTKRKHSEAECSEAPWTKYQKLGNIINFLYGSQHPRHGGRNFIVSLMILCKIGSDCIGTDFLGDWIVIPQT